MTKQRAKIRIVRTEKKGLRPSISPLPAGIRIEDINKAAGKVESIIANSHFPTEQDFLLLKYIQMLCKRVIAFERREYSAMNHFDRELQKASHKLHRLGFEEQRIVSLNLWITRRVILQQGALENLLKRVEEKIERAKK